ncbi:NADPH-dependent oxidoreductase [Bacillus coahuilensis p1.1.43]|uniref:NADPH-dependent oxidoreductase n=1 Tax=Bacillus coahuilensis p1.1.43 TaxID=1150625 RepID=A0A147KBE0_9BACI|nr:oxygen-insensitive NADPH nitroreductase [Bacillus coahuilensis]KUP08480.1 NADPH-dependent oxidoreductase [Bacillus coahuilensis p1.1.43]
MNETIRTILEHRSIRHFSEDKLTKEDVKLLVQSAQAASTSSYIQAYSIIGVTDRQKKEKLAELAGGQQYVADNGHLFVFCADFYRHEEMAKAYNLDVSESVESTEKFMVGVIDAALAAQNMSVAAESMGLGICYIGGIRNDLQGVSELLQLPHLVLPLFGLVVGHPTKETDQKPRLPLQHIYHENGYHLDHATHLEEYDELISSYYHERTGGKRHDRWTEQITGMLSMPKRMYMKQFVESKGYNKR